MSEDNELVDWLTSQFMALPRSQDRFFDCLWQQEHLRLVGANATSDLYDHLSARLVCAALQRRQSLLIVLPDALPHRPALLLATALIMYGVDQYAVGRPGGQVLYFGATTGIRQQLQQVQVDNTRLDTVFPQAYTTTDPSHTRSITPQRRTPCTLGPEDSFHFPRVLTVYAPAEPTKILQHQRAEWIAIDCSDGLRLHWLPSLLAEAQKRQCPVVAWCNNPLSSAVNDFIQNNGLIFRWPHASTSVTRDPSPKQMATCLSNRVITQLTPLLVDETAIPSVLQPLRRAYITLAEATDLTTERMMGALAQDALRLAWGYLRTLEHLAVPFDFYEAEAPHIWGLRRLGSMDTVLARFLVALQPTYPSLAHLLEQCFVYLTDARTQFQRRDPPLWTALGDLCVADVPSSKIRLLVFPGPARRQMFAYALLARHNITEDELGSINVRLTSLKELHQAILHNIHRSGADADDIATLLSDDNWVPILVGLPAYSLTPWLGSVLRQSSSEILLYPYQLSALIQRVNAWKVALTADVATNASVLAHLNGRAVPIVSETSPALLLSDPQALTVAARRRSVTTTDVSLPWKSSDPVAEVNWLLTSDGFEEHETPRGLLLESETTISDEQTDEWLDEAIRVSFSGDWSALFAPNATLNVIIQTTQGRGVSERYVRAIHPGDKVLFIHGQRRQSLYDLLVDRVHQNPSFELHLALIRRWQDDLVYAYHQQSLETRLTFEDILVGLQQRGSKLTSTQTIRLWMQGHTLAPDDVEDLRRLAEVLNLSFVRQHYRRIHKAAARLAGLHRSLAIRLHYWLEQEMTGTQTDTNSLYEAFDAESGLSLQDLRDSLLVLQVESISCLPGPFLSHRLGQLERSAQ